MVKISNGGQTTPSGTLAHFLATDFAFNTHLKSNAYLTPEEQILAKSDYLRPHLKSKNAYLTPDEQILAKSDYLRPIASPKRSSNYLMPNEISLAKSDYLRPTSPRQPRSSLSLKADSVEVETQCKTLRPRVQQQSHSYSVTTLRRQRAVSPPCDCLPTEPIPPPELFDF